MTEHTPQQY